MLTLNQEVARLKATRNVTALQEMSASMQSTINFAKARIAEMTADREHPVVLTENTKKNLAQAERNLALVQGAVDDIFNSK